MARERWSSLMSIQLEAKTRNNLNLCKWRWTSISSLRETLENTIKPICLYINYTWYVEMSFIIRRMRRACVAKAFDAVGCRTNASRWYVNYPVEMSPSQRRDFCVAVPVEAVPLTSLWAQPIKPAPLRWILTLQQVRGHQSEDASCVGPLKPFTYSPTTAVRRTSLRVNTKSNHMPERLEQRG